MNQERYVINHERAEWVVMTLLDAWRRKLPPFDHAEPVPEKLPSNIVPGSLEHVMFLFKGLVFMRGRIDSAEAFKRYAVVCEEHPWILDPKNLAKSGYAEWNVRCRLRKILLDAGLGFGVQDALKFWIYNSKKLVRFWDGNPLNIFKEAENYEELCALFMDGKNDPDSHTGFLGIRHKMVSMFIYFLARGKILSFEYLFAAPFDIHHSRVMTCTESIVSVEDIRPGMVVDFYSISPVGRELHLTYCKTPDDVLDFADAVWYLSRDFCAQSQGNTSTRREKLDEKLQPGQKVAWPLEKISPRVRKIGRKRTVNYSLHEKPVVWTDEKIQQYNRTCGLCSLESVCGWTLPTAPNYGEVREPLIIRGKRPQPHELQENLLEVPITLAPRPPKPQKVSLPAQKHEPSFFD